MSHLLGSGALISGHLYWWQECLRALVIFAYGLAIVRFFGRRVFGRWSALDIVVSVIVGSSLSRALTGNAEMAGTIAATTVMMALHWVLAKLAARSHGVARLVEGPPVHLARNGQVQRAAMLRESVSERDLNEALHQSGVEDPANTRLIVLEPSGKITVLKA